MLQSQPDKDFPWWLLVAAAILGYMLYRVIADDLYYQVLVTLG